MAQHDQQNPSWINQVQPHQMIAGKVLRALDNIVIGFPQLDTGKQRSLVQQLTGVCQNAKRQVEAAETPFQIISEAESFTQGRLHEVTNKDARNTIGQLYSLALAALWTDEFRTPNGQRIPARDVLTRVDDGLMTIDRDYKFSTRSGARPLVGSHAGQGEYPR